MLMDLFSVFDYQAYVSWENPKFIFLFWSFSLFLPTSLYAGGAWPLGSGAWAYLGMPLVGWAWEESQSKVKESSVALLFISGGLWVTLVNLWQAVPGVFVSISHLSVSASVALPFWSAMVLTSALTCTNELMASLVPEGTPIYLILFMVIVEVFSHFMRPLALCLRLSLTMMAGHILLGLILGNMAELVYDAVSLQSIMEVSDFWSEFAYSLIKDKGWDPRVEESVIWGVWGCRAVMSYSLGILMWALWLSISIGVILGELVVGLLQAYIFFTLILFFNSQYPRV